MAVIRFLSATLLMVSLSAVAGDWPLSRGDQDEILGRRPAKTPQLTEGLRAQLISVFHFTASMAARGAYWKHLNENWNQFDPESKRRAVLVEAERKAIDASQNEITKWKALKSASGKPASVGILLSRMLPSNTATETFHEWDRFLDDDGKINYRSREFGADSRLAESQRSPSDSFAFVNPLFRGTPEERKKIADEAAKRWAAVYSSVPTASKSRGAPYVSTHSCGTPSANAAALCPEFNGMR